MALNPIIKFTTLFGLLAVELAVSITAQGQQLLTHVLAAVFFAVSLWFVHRSFYGMRIGETMQEVHQSLTEATSDGRPSAFTAV